MIALADTLILERVAGSRKHFFGNLQWAPARSFSLLPWFDPSLYEAENAKRNGKLA